MLIRPRRLRKNQKIRNLVRETVLTKNDLIMPIFVDEHLKGNEKKKINSMPNQYRFSVEGAIEEAKEIADLGIPAVILFGIPKYKDEIASSAYDKNGVVQRTIRGIKKELGDELLVIADCCLCEYTSHGHCGIVKDGKILNDATLPILAKIALSYAEAGVDIVAPSDMMDGRVKAIREILEDSLDIDNALDYYKKIQKRKIYYLELPTPSPFAFNLVVSASSDVIFMEDKKKMIAELHKKVMEFISRKRK